jgi:hypothetical protein
MTPIEPINTDVATDEDDDGMRAEYDFSNGVRGKHAARFAEGLSVRILDKDGKVLEEKSREAEEEIRRMIRENPQD